MYAEITRLNVKPDAFRILWLFYISGVNTKQHCQKSFRGFASALIDVKKLTYSNIVLKERDYPLLYLCGVAFKPNTAIQKNGNNFHLALRLRAQSSVVCQEHGIDVELQNVERLRIDPVDHPPADLDDSFTKCRNWQFAMALEKAGGQPEAMARF